MMALYGSHEMVVCHAALGNRVGAWRGNGPVERPAPRLVPTFLPVRVLFDGPPDSVNENVDEVVSSLGAHAGEDGLQACGVVGVGVTDDLLSVGGEGQLDASTIARVPGAAHQPGMGQPIDHRGGGRQSGPQNLSQLGEADRGQRTDEVQRDELKQRHSAARPDGRASHDHCPQVGDEPVDVLRRDYPRVVAPNGSSVAAGRADARQCHVARTSSPPCALRTDRHVVSLGSTPRCLHRRERAVDLWPIVRCVHWGKRREVSTQIHRLVTQAGSSLRSAVHGRCWLVLGDAVCTRFMPGIVRT
jgi:hypothetical protein